MRCMQQVTVKTLMAYRFDISWLMIRGYANARGQGKLIFHQRRLVVTLHS